MLKAVVYLHLTTRCHQFIVMQYHCTMIWYKYKCSGRIYARCYDDHSVYEKKKKLYALTQRGRQKQKNIKKKLERHKRLELHKRWNGAFVCSTLFEENIILFTFFSQSQHNGPHTSIFTIPFVDVDDDEKLLNENAPNADINFVRCCCCWLNLHQTRP